MKDEEINGQNPEIEETKSDNIDTQNKDNEIVNSEISDSELQENNSDDNENKPKKEKIKFKEALSNKRIRYGTYTSVMTLGVIAIVIIINLLVGQLNLKFDLTTNKMFSISDQTKTVVSELNKDVNIYTTYQTGSENIQFIEMLDKYKDLSSKIKITNKDPNLNPTFMQKYVKGTETIASGSIIVESGDRFKVLSPYDLVDYQPNYQTYSYQATGIALESKVTGAIQYVTTDNLPIAYVIEGHEEFELPSTAQKSLEDENYEVKSLNILTTGAIPDDASILIINPPTRDYSKDEAKIVTDYLTKGGRAIFTLSMYREDMTNYESILASYGVKPQNKLIVEGDSSYSAPNNPITLMPNIESHDITNSITSNKLNILLGNTQGIEILEEKNANTKITPLLTTSKSAYAKSNDESVTLAKESGDIEGPFNLAVLIEDSWFNDSQSYQSKVVVISTYNLFGNYGYGSLANTDLFMNSINYLVDKQDSIYIRSKSLAVEQLSLNATQALILCGISVILIPIVILVIGAVIWFRRKNK